eukprot:gene18004-biopygen7626
MQTRAKKRQDLQEPSTRIQFGQKSFAVWAPRLINEANLEDEDTEEEEEEEDKEDGDEGRKTQQMPADEFEKQRLSYYGYLENKYADQIETVEDGTLGVTQWMQEWKATAWYRRPGKAQKIDNVDLWKKIDYALENRSAKREYARHELIGSGVSAVRTPGRREDHRTTGDDMKVRIGGMMENVVRLDVDGRAAPARQGSAAAPLLRSKWL